MLTGTFCPPSGLTHTATENWWLGSAVRPVNFSAAAVPLNTVAVPYGLRISSTSLFCLLAMDKKFRCWGEVTSSFGRRCARVDPVHDARSAASVSFFKTFPKWRPLFVWRFVRRISSWEPVTWQAHPKTSKNVKEIILQMVSWSQWNAPWSGFDVVEKISLYCSVLSANVLRNSFFMNVQTSEVPNKLWLRKCTTGKFQKLRQFVFLQVHFLYLGSKTLVRSCSIPGFMETAKNLVLSGIWNL